jgi:leucyl/phenylalanyl-tRNA--protein transferase
MQSASGGYVGPPFPPVEEARSDGLLAIGGDLSVPRLLEAYRHGIFPWYEEGLPVLWWSPDPRAILELDGLYVSQRLERTMRSRRFRISFDGDFRGVIRGCATAHGPTWITREMLAAYTRLHDRGHAHSVEVWHDDRLAGGIYGVQIGGFFAGESMFYRARDASKVALVALVRHLAARGFALFDLQILNDHTQSLGAVEISRSVYLRRLREAVKLPVTF